MTRARSAMAVVPETFHYDGVGVRLAGERWEGDGSDGVVVLLHGGGQTRHSWGRTAERLAAGGRTAVALDARGHGDSEWHPAQDYTLDGFVADLIAFISTLDGPPVLVGASLGGITSLAAAGEHPGLARGLVLVDIVVQAEPTGVARIREFMTAHDDGFSSLEEVADAVAAYNPVRRRPRDPEGLRKNERLRVAASHVTIPTLVVRGAQSDVVSDAGLADMLRLIPQAQSVDVQAAAHMVAGDDNDVFADRLEAFLSRLDADAER